MSGNPCNVKIYVDLIDDPLRYCYTCPVADLCQDQIVIWKSLNLTSQLTQDIDVGIKMERSLLVTIGSSEWVPGSFQANLYNNTSFLIDQ